MRSLDKLDEFLDGLGQVQQHPVTNLLAEVKAVAVEVRADAAAIQGSVGSAREDAQLAEQSRDATRISEGNSAESAVRAQTALEDVEKLHEAVIAARDTTQQHRNVASAAADAATLSSIEAEEARDLAEDARMKAAAARDTAQGHRTAAGNSATAAAGRATAAGDAKAAAETARDAAVAARAASETARDASVEARTAAEAAATQSQEGAARLAGTSTTPRVPAVGSLAFTTQAGKGFAVGSWLMVQSRGSVDRWAFGKVSAYNSSTGAVTVQAEAIGADQTEGNDWNLLIAGARGPATPLDGLGYGQTWQSVSRAPGTVYQNTTGKPIVFSMYYQAGSGPVRIQVSATTSFSGSMSITSALNQAISVVVPHGQYYTFDKVTAGITADQFVTRELR